MRLALAVLALALVVGCKGIASSASSASNANQPAAAGGAGAPSANASAGGSAKVVIDRDCSKLEDPGDEYVCIKNEDSRPADMSSWVLRNVMGRSYNFKPGFTLPAGQTVKLHTGAGTDSTTDLYWNYSVKPAWEKIDKLTLHNSEDAEIFVSEPKRG